MSGVVLTLYRIVGGETPVDRDFQSKMLRDLRPRSEERERPELWTGLSMYETPEAARATARDFPILGTHIAEVSLDRIDRRYIVLRQTLRDGHYTVWVPPYRANAAVVAVEPV